MSAQVIDLFDILDVEQLLVRYLQSFNFDFVQPPADNPGGRQRVFAGAENLDVQGPNPEGVPIDDSVPQEGEESSIIRTPCIIASCQVAETPSPTRELAGLWEPKVRVEVISDAADSTSGDRTLSTDHRMRVKQVWRRLLINSLARDLGEFSKTCGVLPPDAKFHAACAIGFEQGWGIEGHCWTSTLSWTFRQACLVPIDFIEE